MSRPFPRPWVATGCGSYRELRPGVFEISWRPAGRAGSKLRRRVAWRESEILSFLSSQADNRQRRSLGVRELATWEGALLNYEARLEAKGVRPGYIKESLALLVDLREFSRVALDRLTAQDVQRWVDARAVELRGRRAGWARTMNKRLSMVAPFFRRLSRSQLAVNPLAEVERFPEVRRLRRMPAPEEYAAVWSACEGSLRDLLDWLLLTGCRLGEAARAKRVDVAGQVWRIGNRKGRNDHAVPLPAVLVEVLLRQPAHKDGLIFHRWVRPVPARAFHPFHEGGPINGAWLSRCLKFRCKAAGVPYFTAHGLRHAAVDWSDADARKVQGLVGHSQIQTTEKYMHGFKLAGAKVVQKMLESQRNKAIKSIQGNNLPA